MVGISNLNVVAAITGQAGTAGSAASGTGGHSFASLLAQVIAVDETVAAQTEAGQTEGGDTTLATALGQLRQEAQDDLAEAFPDGVIVPGEKLNDWAKSVLTRLDGMLQDAGAEFSDLMQVLAPLEDLSPEGSSLLVQAAQALLGGATGAGGLLPAAASGTIIATVATPPRPGTVATGSVTNGTVTNGTAPTTGSPGGTVAPQINPDDPAATPLFATDSAGRVLSNAVSAQPETNALVAGPKAKTGQDDTASLALGAAGQGAGDGVTSAPLPDALRLILAQAVAAPAASTLPPEIQAILAAPQGTPAVVGVPLAAPVATPQTPQQSSTQNGFARNLAGQIRGVSFSEGTTRIELSPQGLGSIEIEIAPDEAGKLRVVLRAENPAVLNAMRSDREMLAGLLRDGGTTVDDSAMSFEDLGQRRGEQGQETPGARTANPTNVVEDEPESTQSTTPPVVDGRLNILT